MRAGLFCRRSVSVFVGCFRYGYNIRAIMHLPVFASEGFVPIYVVAGLPDELTFRFVRNSVEASPVIVTVMSYPIPWAFGRFFGSQTAVNKRFRQFIVGVCDYVFAYSRYFACILEPIFVTDYQFSVVGVFCFGYFTIPSGIFQTVGQPFLLVVFVANPLDDMVVLVRYPFFQNLFESVIQISAFEFLRIPQGSPAHVFSVYVTVLPSYT